MGPRDVAPRLQCLPVLLLNPVQQNKVTKRLIPGPEMETEPAIPNSARRDGCNSLVSREDPNYSMDQGPDPLGRHGNSWMSWGWTIRRWVEPTDGNCLQEGSHVQTGAGSTSTPEACPGRGWGGFQSVLGPHARVQARGPFPSRSRSLFNLGVITTPFVFLLKWFSQVTFNYSKTLPHTDHVPEYISNWFSVTPLHTHSLQCPKL